MSRKVNEYWRFMEYIRSLTTDASAAIADLAIQELRQFLKPKKAAKKKGATILADSQIGKVKE